MNEDKSFKALMNPGDADNFFDIANLAAFEPQATHGYSRTNALWLAEFCRLIYRRERDEIPTRLPDFRTRDEFLSPRGWRQEPSAFFNRCGTQAAFFVHEKIECAVLVFRGTLGVHDTITDLEFVPRSWQGRGHVHSGFKKALDAVWQPIEARLRSISFPIFFTGHSLGAALATLAAARCLLDPSMNSPAALYTFGSPRVGDATFGSALQGLFHCRIVNDKDIVPTVPPVLNIPLIPTCHHTGQMHGIEHDGHLHIYPPEFDILETRNPLGSVLDLVRSLPELFTNVLRDGTNLPESFTDHTPVNYTAYLEKAS
jgi:triacylglycerol lipase